MLIKNEKMWGDSIRAIRGIVIFNVDNVISIESTCNMYVVKCADEFRYFFDKKYYTIEYGKEVVII